MALLLGCLGVHWLLFFLYGWLSRHQRWPRFASVLELGYGLLNPVAYLVLFQPALLRRWSPEWLTGLSWIALTSYWVIRFSGAALLPSQLARHIVPRVLSVCFFLASAVAAR